uniref:Uncharacterized protein n=1 Tax=viral metagenome TaxID=1070528 RepID=A0A6H1ZMF3_9ZZZZ
MSKKESNPDPPDITKKPLPPSSRIPSKRIINDDFDIINAMIERFFRTTKLEACVRRECIHNALNYKLPEEMGGGWSYCRLKTIAINENGICHDYHNPGEEYFKQH